jgi:hypothetical protein
MKKGVRFSTDTFFVFESALNFAHVSVYEMLWNSISEIAVKFKNALF